MKRDVEREAQAGRRAARELDPRTAGDLATALVFGEFDWRDVFADKPSKEFLRGFTDEIMWLDHYG